MSDPERVVEFDAADPTPLLAVMDELARTRAGWVNLQPVPPDDDELHERRGRAGVFALFSGKGPALPIGTWVPGELTRKGVQPDSLGLQHAGGPKARFTLAEADTAVPQGWRLLADHPKRGLVVELPAGTPPAVAVDWLLRAAAVLAPEPLPDRWLAAVYGR